ncbi:MAG TPA: hypothetical protein VIX91_06230 [Candidatus Acidoferrum sp.]
MTNMDHNEAVRLQAAEKYLLGKLPKEQHAAYEEHYFDCYACAEEIKATAAFMEGARQVAPEEILKTIDDRRLVPVSPRARGWFDWLLRPAFAVPIFAALLVFVTYQNSVTIPGLKQPASREAIGEVVKSFPVMHLNPRGVEASPVVFNVGPHQGFDIDVDIADKSASGFTCEIQDQAGKALVSFHVSGDDVKNAVRFHIAGGSLRPGKYSLLVYKGQAPRAKADNASAVGKKSFSVEFLQ